MFFMCRGFSVEFKKSEDVDIYFLYRVNLTGTDPGFLIRANLSFPSAHWVCMSTT